MVDAITKQQLSIENCSLSIDILFSSVMLQFTNFILSFPNLSFQDKGILRREQLEAAETIIKQEASPAPSSAPPCPPGILTPPASNRKSAEISMPN
jgi:hypothetical protein